ncbi:MAG: hypothetical protein LJE92_19050 [Gammaproteobacteria bacterium]|jgi:hypothetical protein|nr:hypothetical protein [Gammaproteobacteria bacterium]
MINLEGSKQVMGPTSQRGVDSCFRDSDWQTIISGSIYSAKPIFNFRILNPRWSDRREPASAARACRSADAAGNVIFSDQSALTNVVLTLPETNIAYSVAVPPPPAAEGESAGEKNATRSAKSRFARPSDIALA